LGIAFIGVSNQQLRLYHLWSIASRSILAPFALIHLAFIELVEVALAKLPRTFTPGQNARSIIKGVSFGALLLFGVVLPLLMNSDKAFSGMITDLLVPLCDFLNNLFSPETLVRAITFGVSAIAVIALYISYIPRIAEQDCGQPQQPAIALSLTVALIVGLGFGLPAGFGAGVVTGLVGMLINAAHAKFDKDAESDTPLDDLTYGIVFCMVGLTYLLFLAFQVKQIFGAPAAISFRGYEALAKKGFWQLLVLTALNIGLVIQTYGRLAKFGSVSLRVFTLLSTLLLGTAGHRLGSYVFFFGLSYEKWYACYTVLFCALVFALLACYQWKPSTINSRFEHPMKAVLLLLVWMYGMVSIVPVGSSIVLLNRQFSLHRESGIDHEELSYLGADAVPAILYSLPATCIRNGGCQLNQHPETKDNYWLYQQSGKLSQRPWYQHSLTSLIGSHMLSERGAMDPMLRYPSPEEAYLVTGIATPAPTPPGVSRVR
jgi:hypothetical protein